MSVTELRSGLHRLVDAVSDEQLLTAIFTLLDKQAALNVIFGMIFHQNNKPTFSKDSLI